MGALAAAFIAVVGALTLAGVLMFAGYALRGWVLVKLWGWFAVAGLHALPISIPLAIGLSIIVGYATQGPVDYAQDPDKKSRTIRAVSGFFTPFLVLLIGYIVHLFM
jgi:uncharacterized membrane protein YcfT